MKLPLMLTPILPSEIYKGISVLEWDIIHAGVNLFGHLLL